VVLVFLATIVFIAVVVGALLYAGRREHSATAREINAVLALPVDQARKQAETLLADSRIFKTAVAADPPHKAGLPDDVVALFSRYQEVSKHEFWLGHAALQETPRVPGHIKIGGDAEFEEILVRPGQQTVWLSYPPSVVGSNPEAMPSVWHKLLLVASEPQSASRG